MTDRSTPPLDVATAIEKLATYPYLIATWIDETGYPMSVAVEGAVDAAANSVTFTRPAGLDLPTDDQISLTGSHIRPQPGYGYDERRHVTVWGSTTADGDRLSIAGHSAWGWDEAETPFFEYSERSVPQSRRYFDALSAERGTPVKPRLSFGFLTLRTTRLPFLTATIVPVVLGILIAATHGRFDLVAAVLTIVGAAFVHLGVNVSNDVFDSIQGADDANVTPTQFSGGSRVIQYGLVSLRQMATLATAFLGLAALVGLVLLAAYGSSALLIIGISGFVLGIGYTAPPLKLVYRGLGEIAVAIGFGPLMLVGAYVVQTGGAITIEPLLVSIPVALLIALILYVNEIPDRRGDGRVAKRTLPVRFAPSTIITGYRVAAGAAYASVVLAVLGGYLPWPTLLMLLTIPMALRIARGLKPNYDSPYGLMAVMGVNVQLHLRGGLLLGAAYLAVLAVGAIAPGARLFLG